MSNPYYSYTSGVPVSQSRGVSSQIRAEFSTISAGFDAINTALGMVAPITSPNFQGNPSAPTQTPGTATTALATCAFVMAAAFSATLPSQTGNAGKYITTNGTTASWAAISWLLFSQDTKRVLTASTATTNIDLAAGDNATVFKVTMSSNTTLTFLNFPAAPAGETFTFSLMTINDATAGRALAWGNTIKWAGGVVPTRTTTANAVDIYSLWYEGSVLYGSLSIIDAK